MAVANYPALHQSQSEDELLQSYYARGYTYKSNTEFRYLKASFTLKETQVGLKRRLESPLEEVEVAIEVHNEHI